MKKQARNCPVLSSSKGWRGLPAVILFLAVAVFPASAQDPIEVKPFHPPTGSTSAVNDFSAAAMDYFDFIGQIDYILPERIVVYDTNFVFAPGVSIASGLQQGMFVGLKLDSRRRVVEIERLEMPDTRER